MNITELKQRDIYLLIIINLSICLQRTVPIVIYNIITEI